MLSILNVLSRFLCEVGPILSDERRMGDWPPGERLRLLNGGGPRGVPAYETGDGRLDIFFGVTWSKNEGVPDPGRMSLWPLFMSE